jgi:hypothetical protein
MEYETPNNFTNQNNNNNFVPNQGFPLNANPEWTFNPMINQFQTPPQFIQNPFAQLPQNQFQATAPIQSPSFLPLSENPNIFNIQPNNQTTAFPFKSQTEYSGGGMMQTAFQTQPQNIYNNNNTNALNGGFFQTENNIFLGGQCYNNNVGADPRMQNLGPSQGTRQRQARLAKVIGNQIVKSVALGAAGVDEDDDDEEYRPDEAVVANPDDEDEEEEWIDEDNMQEGECLTILTRRLNIDHISISLEEDLNDDPNFDVQDYLRFRQADGTQH